MIISAIVAAGENSAIGLKNDLPWRLPNDMKFYKYTTWGMPVIMGRTSWDSLGRKRLPGRFNIVLSHQPDLHVTDPEVWTANTLHGALNKAARTSCREVFIIGGAKVYSAFMDLTERIYLTRVHASPEADTFFPEPDWSKWTLRQSRRCEPDAQHAYAYTFETWERKR